MRRKIVGVLTIVALLSIAAAGIGKANAYFTTYAEAIGSRTIHLGDRTHIDENYEGWKKDIRVDNRSNSDQAVYVRARGVAGQEYSLKYTGTDWVEGNDGFWYFGGQGSETPVAPGESTTTLRVEIKDALTGGDPVAIEGRSFDVVVVYETTPAVQGGQDEDGNILYEAANWSRGLTSVTEGGEE